MLYCCVVRKQIQVRTVSKIQSVYEQLSVLAQALATNPELFGQRIMGAQEQLAQLKSRLETMHGQAADDLRAQIHAREKNHCFNAGYCG